MGRVARSLVAAASLVVGLGASTASAQVRPPITLFPGQLAGVAVVGAESDGTVAAGSTIALRLAGAGRCMVDVAVREPSARSYAYVQSFDVALGGREPTMLGYRMGPYGPDGAPVIVRVAPRAPCRGSVAQIVVRVARPRIVIPTRPPAPGQAPPTPGGAPSGSSAPPVVPPPVVPSGAKPATGNLTQIQVPGGSFAEDEAQRLELSGTGGCALDLRISNKSYGGTFEKTFAVAAMGLAAHPRLYNGTHFDTLAEGSYHADATAKNGCTGAAAIDFKVTARTSTASVKGKPTVSLDRAPLAGSAYKKSKDSNVWFKVSVPSSFKDAGASCCEIELDYVNAYGGWEVLPNSPFSDPGMNPLANGNQAVPKSVSYFTVPGEAATKWRIRVRGYRYKTTFEWSDWLEFSVDQN